jgi:hypothetical protein
MQRTKRPISRPRSSGESATKSTTTVRRDIGREILEGVRELKQGRNGHITTLPPIAGTREALALSQAEFARQRKALAAAFPGWGTVEVGSLVDKAVAAARRKPGKR